MKKKMEEIDIRIDGLRVVLSQPYMGEDDQKIFIPYEQISIIIKWLREADNEIQRYING